MRLSHAAESDAVEPAPLFRRRLRASLSVCLNLAEETAKPSQKDRQRFYAIAFASLREVQSLIELEDELADLTELADRLGAHLYKLTKAKA